MDSCQGDLQSTSTALIWRWMFLTMPTTTLRSSRHLIQLPACT